MARTTSALPLVACALGAATAALLAGCTGGSGGGVSSPTTGSASSSTTSSTGSGSPTTTVVRSSATESLPPPRPVAEPDAVPRGDDQVFAGSDGDTTWDLWLPVFVGGPADALNSKVRASADYGVRAASADGGPHTITADGVVTTNDGRTVQVRISLLDEPYDDVEPVESVTTVALTADDASPVFLEQQLADPGAAWGVLAREATAAAQARGLTVERPLEATAEEFADWQTSVDGLELSFQHGQLGPGAPDVVLPWRVVEPLLTPEGAALLAP